jgi:hypothetical protein
MAGTKPGHDEEVRENLKSLVRKMLPSDMLTPFAMSGAICMGAGSLPDRNLTFGLHVRRARAAVKRGACVIHLGSQVDGFLDQTGCNVGVSGCFGEFEKRYRLTRKILPIDHSVFPDCQPPGWSSRCRGIRSREMCKSVLKDVVPLEPGVFCR